MALPVTDSFTNTDGVALETHGNWSGQGTGGGANSWEITSNTATPDSTQDGAFWENVETWPDDQYAEADIGAMNTSSGNIGVAVRCAQSTDKTSYYFAVRNFGSTKRILGKHVSDAHTTLDSDGGVPSVGQTLRIEVSGTSLTALVNGSSVLSATDSAITSGAGGIFSNNQSGTGKSLDNWEAGSLAAAAANPKGVIGGLVLRGALGGPIG